MVLESSSMLNAIHLIHGKQIRPTAKIDGESYLFARFLTIIRNKILMFSGS